MPDKDAVFRNLDRKLFYFTLEYTRLMLIMFTPTVKQAGSPMILTTRKYRSIEKNPHSEIS